MEEKQHNTIQAIQQSVYEVKGKLNLLGEEAYRQHKENAASTKYRKHQVSAARH